MKTIFLLISLWFPPDINQYVKYISGNFSTYNQSLIDSTFDNVLVYTRVVRRDNRGIWVYTEQGEARNYTPYRQRVYLITNQDSVLLQKIYTIKNPQQFSRRNFARISFDDLEYKQGCDVIIRKMAPEMYKGTTDSNTCVATFRGSTYTTSIFMVRPYGVISWERGWNDNHQQVWGSTRGYYIYEKI